MAEYTIIEAPRKLLGDDGRRIVDELLGSVRPGTEVWLDCSAVQSMDSSSLAALITHHRRFEAQEGKLVLLSPPPTLMELLKITRLDKFFRIRHAEREDESAAREDTAAEEEKPEGESAGDDGRTPGEEPHCPSCGRQEGIEALSCTLPAFMPLLPHVVELATAFLEQTSTMPSQDLALLDTAISEAVANAIKHGKGRSVGLTVHAWPGHVRIYVYDGGEGFDPDEVPEPDFTGEKLNGRGLFIMRSVTDRLKYLKLASEHNVLVMEKFCRKSPEKGPGK